MEQDMQANFAGTPLALDVGQGSSWHLVAWYILLILASWEDGCCLMFFNDYIMGATGSFSFASPTVLIWTCLFCTAALLRIILTGIMHTVLVCCSWASFSVLFLSANSKKRLQKAGNRCLIFFWPWTLPFRSFFWMNFVRHTDLSAGKAPKLTSSPRLSQGTLCRGGKHVPWPCLRLIRLCLKNWHIHGPWISRIFKDSSICGGYTWGYTWGYQRLGDPAVFGHSPEALCHTFGTSCQHDPFMVAAMGAVAEIWGNWSLEWFRYL